MFLLRMLRRALVSSLWLCSHIAPYYRMAIKAIGLYLIFFNPFNLLPLLFTLPKNLVHLASTGILTTVSYLRTWLTTLGNIPFLNRFGIGPSRIPQFLLDTGHSWIKANRKLLEQIDAKSALLTADSSLRSLIDPIPNDLYERLYIGNDRRRYLGSLGWQYATTRLTEIMSCQLAMTGCKTLEVDIYRQAGGKGTLWEPSIPPSNLLDILFNTLNNMPNLQTLMWRESSRPSRVAGSYRDDFIRRELQLSAVKHLSLGLDMDFLVPMSPNVESIQVIYNDPWEAFGSSSRTAQENLVKSARETPSLIEFTMKAEWDVELLESVLKSMPQLRILRMRGEIERKEPFFRSSCQKLQAISHVLAQFKHLSTLEVPSAAYLGVGFDGGPECGNAYDGLGGTRYGRYVSRQYMWANEKAAKIILAEVPHLQRLAIGKTQPKEIISGQITWPWTGKIKEHLLYEWPRYRASENIGYGIFDEDPEGPIFYSLKQEEIILRDDWEPGDELLFNRLKSDPREGSRDEMLTELEEEEEREFELLRQEMQM